MKKGVVASVIALIAILGASNIANADETTTGNLICKPTSDGSGELICHQAQGARVANVVERVGPSGDDTNDTNTSKAKKKGNSGFLLGINLGISGGGPGGGLRLGYQKAFRYDMGLRFYASYNFFYSSGILDNLLAFNIDYYYNFFRGLGFYVGSGVAVEAVFGGQGTSSGSISHSFSSSSFSPGPNYVSSQQVYETTTKLQELGAKEGEIEDKIRDIESNPSNRDETTLQSLKEQDKQIKDQMNRVAAFMPENTSSTQTEVSDNSSTPSSSTSSSITANVYIPFNLGFQYDFGHSIISLGVKIPVYYITGTIVRSTVSYTAGYTYVW
ncbi:hypothetical protein BKH43_06145 [Helicobacter sp. 13S00401-1]|uniref:YdcH family protein n=1 Tax=Helicobacter sp. 13S00401-1 TaxID=1905758 RepID=UPI000BA51EB7|nr:YdcH family protein [Helicobacter sp. 13S00401-1]PAF50071.1 hypothetical protein BKH43_06145 [Helicobacter sp. 13S00401-1]